MYQSDDDIVSSWESIKEGEDTWKNLKPFTNLTRMLLCILHHFGLQLWKLGGCCLPYTTHKQYENISFWCPNPVYHSFIDCKTLSWHMQDGKFIITFSVAGWDRWPLEECHSTQACWELSKDQCFHDAAIHHPHPIHWSCPCLMHQTYKHNQWCNFVCFDSFHIEVTNPNPLATGSVLPWCCKPSSPPHTLIVSILHAPTLQTQPVL